MEVKYINQQIGNINQQILRIWENEYKNDLWTLDNKIKAPLFYPENLNKNSILFISLNPSSSDKLNKIDSKYTENINSFYNEVNKGNIYPKITQIQEIEIKIKKEYSYFKPFREISEKVALEWEHIDLFFKRDTNQKNIESGLKEEKKKKFKFFEEQLLESFKLIDIINPKIIVVSNSHASGIVKSRLNLTFENFDDTIGTYIYRNNIPVFLSGMLKTLDLYSRERLELHIKEVIRRKNITP